MRTYHFCDFRSTLYLCTAMYSIVKTSRDGASQSSATICLCIFNNRKFKRMQHIQTYTQEAYMNFSTWILSFLLIEFRVSRGWYDGVAVATSSPKNQTHFGKGAGENRKIGKSTFLSLPADQGFNFLFEPHWPHGFAPTIETQPVGIVPWILNSWRQWIVEGSGHPFRLSRVYVILVRVRAGDRDNATIWPRLCWRYQWDGPVFVA